MMSCLVYVNTENCNHTITLNQCVGKHLWSHINLYKQLKYFKHDENFKE